MIGTTKQMSCHVLQMRHDWPEAYRCFCEVYGLMLEAEESGKKIEAVEILSPEEYAAEIMITGKAERTTGRQCHRPR